MCIKFAWSNNSSTRNYWKISNNRPSKWRIINHQTAEVLLAPLFPVHVVPGPLLPLLVTAGPVVLPGHAPEAAGAAALLLHEAGVQIGLVIRAADWLQRGRAHPATPAPLEHRQTLGQRHLGRERSDSDGSAPYMAMGQVFMTRGRDWQQLVQGAVPQWDEDFIISQGLWSLVLLLHFPTPCLLQLRCNC